MWTVGQQGQYADLDMDLEALLGRVQLRNMQSSADAGVVRRSGEVQNAAACIDGPQVPEGEPDEVSHQLSRG